MTAEENRVTQVGDSPHVRKSCPRLHHVNEPHQAIGLNEAWKSQDRMNAKVELEQVERKEWDQVQRKVSWFNVSSEELPALVDDQTVFQITSSELNKNIEQVYDVTKDVGGYPQRGVAGGKLWECLPGDASPQIVEDCGCDHGQPAVEGGVVWTDD